MNNRDFNLHHLLSMSREDFRKVNSLVYTTYWWYILLVYSSVCCSGIKSSISSRAADGGGVGVDNGVGVGWSRPFWPESELELESGKFCRLRLQPGVAGYHHSTEDDFGRKY